MVVSKFLTTFATDKETDNNNNLDTGGNRVNTALIDMIQSIKNNGKIAFSQLSKKQVIALVSLWNSSFVKKENASFSDMLKRCYKSIPWHDNAPIFYIHADEKTVTTVHHAFYDMTEGEEEMLMKSIEK